MYNCFNHMKFLMEIYQLKRGIFVKKYSTEKVKQIKTHIECIIK